MAEMPGLIVHSEKTEANVASAESMRAINGHVVSYVMNYSILSLSIVSGYDLDTINILT